MLVWKGLLQSEFPVKNHVESTWWLHASPYLSRAWLSRISLTPFLRRFLYLNNRDTRFPTTPPEPEVWPKISSVLVKGLWKRLLIQSLWAGWSLHKFPPIYEPLILSTQRLAQTSWNWTYSPKPFRTSRNVVLCKEFCNKTKYWRPIVP